MIGGRAQPQGGKAASRRSPEASGDMSGGRAHTEEVAVFANVPLAIDPDEVLRFQGYKRGIDVPTPDVLALFDEALALGRTLIAPSAAVRWLDVTDRSAGTVVVGGVTLTIPDIERLWGRVERVAAGVCTIGDALERRVSELWDERELPLAVMLDSVGSGAVESLAEYVNDALCQEGIRRDVKVTNRISPGYGTWDVAEQSQLFRRRLRRAARRCRDSCGDRHRRAPGVLGRRRRADPSSDVGGRPAPGVPREEDAVQAPVRAG